MTDPSSVLSVAVDGTPLLGVRTGVGVFVAEALGALARRDDVAPSVFTVTFRGRHQAVPDLPAGVASRPGPPAARPMRFLWRRLDWPPIDRWTGAVDVVHGMNFVVPPARRAAEIVTVYDLTPVRYPHMVDRPSLAFPGLVRRALRRGAWVHVLSRSVAAEMVEHFGADPSRVRVVPSGVPPLAPADGASPVDGPYLLGLGTIEPRKDFPALVRAFDGLASRDPDVRLVVAGPDGWGTPAFEEALAGAAHRHRVVRLGFVPPEQKTALLAGARAFVFPSVYEGFGYPPLEAMAAGVPVVATAVGSLPEVLGDAALSVPGGDAEALADALDRVLTDDGLRHSLVERGRARVARYSWDGCAEGLAALYRDAASS